MNYYSALLATERDAIIWTITVISVSWLAIIIQTSTLFYLTYHIPTLKEPCVMIYYRPFPCCLKEQAICVPWRYDKKLYSVVCEADLDSYYKEHLLF